MAESTTLVTVDEYLSTTYKPACDYLDGVLRQKSMPTWNHSVIQSQISYLVIRDFPAFRTGSEVTVRLSPTLYLVPDLIVQAVSHIQRPYPTDPVHLCVEILSPDDRLSETISKCEQYHAWGVPFVWIIDPDERRAWEFPQGHRLHEIREDGTMTAGPIALALADVFRAL